MEDFKAIITTLKKLYVTFNKDTKGIDNHMLSSSYKRIAPYLDLNSLEELKRVLNEATNKVYTVDGLLLSDEQIVELEYKKIKDAYDTKIIMTNKDISYESDDIENQKLILAEYYLGLLKLFGELDKDKQKEHMDNIKLILARISILLGVENGLYYETFLLFTELLGFKNILDAPKDTVTQTR